MPSITPIPRGWEFVSSDSARHNVGRAGVHFPPNAQPRERYRNYSAEECLEGEFKPTQKEKKRQALLAAEEWRRRRAAERSTYSPEDIARRTMDIRWLDEPSITVAQSSANAPSWHDHPNDVWRYTAAAQAAEAAARERRLRREQNRPSDLLHTLLTGGTT